jgi:5-methylcytosine-specific restriction enzyme subunit McrC
VPDLVFEQGAGKVA